MSTQFLFFVAGMVLLAGAAMFRYLPSPHRWVGLLGLATWIAYTGTLGYAGVIGDTGLRPPGLAFFMLPIVAFVMYMARSNAGRTVALAIPLSLLMGAESYRVVVEIFLHGLWLEGQLPRMMTFSGANFDIVVGATAPIVAWLFASGRISPKAALAWNIFGIIMLANVMARGVLTTPGPLQLIAAEIPNRAIGTFPFTFIPGLLAPLALVLHVLAIRALRTRTTAARRR